MLKYRYVPYSVRPDENKKVAYLDEFLGEIFTLILLITCGRFEV